MESFDTHTDPWQVDNLADQAGQNQRIAKLAEVLDDWMIETRNVGLIPEAMFSDLAGPGKQFESIYEYAQSDQYPVAELLQIARDAAYGDKEKRPLYLDWMTHDNPGPVTTEPTPCSCSVKTMWRSGRRSSTWLATT